MDELSVFSFLQRDEWSDGEVKEKPVCATDEDGIKVNFIKHMNA